MTREEAIFYIKELQKTYASMDKKAGEAVNMAIEALQFAEHFDLLKEYQSLQGVVWCKDCQYCSKYYGKDGHPYWICNKWNDKTDAYKFCYHIERKE